MSHTTTPEKDKASFPLEQFGDEVKLLQGMDLRAHGGLEVADSLIDQMNEYAEEFGWRTVQYSDVFIPTEEDIAPKTPSEPKGFRSEKLVEKGAAIPRRQFEGVIFSIALEKESEDLQTEAHEYITDTGLKVRICDLRGHMTANVEKAGPNPPDTLKLDRAFMQDVKFLLEKGHPKNNVTGVNNMAYTKIKRGISRAYWAYGVEDKNADDNTLTIARIADSAGKNGEARLYERVFRKQL